MNYRSLALFGILLAPFSLQGMFSMGKLSRGVWRHKGKLAASGVVGKSLYDYKNDAKRASIHPIQLVVKNSATLASYAGKGSLEFYTTLYNLHGAFITLTEEPIPYDERCHVLTQRNSETDSLNPDTFIPTVTHRKLEAVIHDGSVDELRCALGDSVEIKAALYDLRDVKAFGVESSYETGAVFPYSINEKNQEKELIKQVGVAHPKDIEQVCLGIAECAKKDKKRARELLLLVSLYKQLKPEHLSLCADFIKELEHENKKYEKAFDQGSLMRGYISMPTLLRERAEKLLKQISQ